jgi:ABC-type sugar transport system substrate-binding protein
MKTFTKLLVPVFAVVLMVAGCGQTSSGSAKKQLTIGISLHTLANPTMIAQQYGYEDEAKKLGIKTILYEAGGYANIDKQIQQLEDLKQQKVDAIILVTANGQASAPVVDEIVDAGIPVVNTNGMTESKKVAIRIRSDDSLVGEKQAEFLAKALKGKGKIVMFNGPSGNSTAMLREQGFKKYMSKYPDIKIVQEFWTDNTKPEGLKLTEDTLQAHPDINGVYTFNEQLGVGTAQALVSSKRTDIFLTTEGFGPDTEAAIKAGQIYATVAQQPVIMARQSVDYALKVINKEKVPVSIFIPILNIDKSNANNVNLSGIRQPNK